MSFFDFLFAIIMVAVVVWVMVWLVKATKNNNAVRAAGKLVSAATTSVALYAAEVEVNAANKIDEILTEETLSRISSSRDKLDKYLSN